VTILQNMAKKSEKEQKDEHVVYDKFMCHCQTERAKVTQSIAEGQTSVPQMASDIEVGETKLKQLLAQRVAAKENSAKATADLSAATEQRETQLATYTKQSEELKGYLDSINGAINALEKGNKGAAFLQGQTKGPLVSAVQYSTALDDDSRAAVTAFLSGATGYAPASSNIIGMFKTMKDDMTVTLTNTNEGEAGQVKLFDELKVAKESQVKSLASAIRKKTSQINDLKVKLVENKGDFGRMKDALASDEKALDELNASCSKREKAQMERVATQQEELLAINDTIKILNSDEVLELFKKTLPSSFLQIEAPERSIQKKALAAIRGMSQKKHPALGLLAMKLSAAHNSLALASVEKSTANIIDGMLKLEAEEQEADDQEKGSCQKRIPKGEFNVRDLKRNVERLHVQDQEKKDSVAAAKAAIAKLKAHIQDLDHVVEEATNQRKEEHATYTELIASNNAAKSVLGVAKKRLAAFFQVPKETVEQQTQNVDKVSLSELMPSYRSFAQISSTSTASEVTESDKIQRMLSKLAHDLDVENAEAEHEEKASQSDFDTLVENSKAKRTELAKALLAKQSIKADGEQAYETVHEAFEVEDEQEHGAEEYMPVLHKECDWLLENYNLRETARDEEAAQLKDVKNILAGSGVSNLEFVQTKATKFLGAL